MSEPVPCQLCGQPVQVIVRCEDTDPPTYVLLCKPCADSEFTAAWDDAAGVRNE